MILGIDEVGRGPWAGPLVIGAVVLPDGLSIEGLTDSKKLSAKRRKQLEAEIKAQAVGWGLGWVHADELDTLGLSESLRVATIRAVEAVKCSYSEIIIDGTINFLKETTKGPYVTTLAKADFLVPAVSAASILAKVARDEYMEEQALLFPGYGFESHVGYGTAAHQKALQEHGVTPLHRTSFAPIKRLLGDTASVQSRDTQTAKAIGDVAEADAVRWLVSEGFEIVERNWKTKYCEIDIIAQKADATYFIEVKYRKTARQGGGIAAITPKKLQQMRFAAELYAARQPSTNAQTLAIIAISEDTQLLELLKVE